MSATAPPARHDVGQYPHGLTILLEEQRREAPVGGQGPDYRVLDRAGQVALHCERLVALLHLRHHDIAFLRDRRDLVHEVGLVPQRRSLSE